MKRNRPKRSASERKREIFSPHLAVNRVTHLAPNEANLLRDLRTHERSDRCLGGIVDVPCSTKVPKRVSAALHIKPREHVIVSLLRYCHERGEMMWLEEVVII